MSKKILSSMLGCMLALSFAACGSDEDSKGSTTNAQVSQSTTAAISVASEALGKIFTQLAKGSSSAGDDFTVTVNGNSFTVMGTVTSAAGGTVEVSGSGTRASATAASAMLDMKFNNWKDAASNLTLNGTLSFGFDITSYNPLTGSETLKGMLSISGATSAMTNFDLKIKFQGAGQYTVCGTVDGNTIGTPGC